MTCPGFYSKTINMGKARRPEQPVKPADPSGEVKCNLLQAVVFLNWCICFWKNTDPPCEE